MGVDGAELVEDDRIGVHGDGGGFPISFDGVFEFFEFFAAISDGLPHTLVHGFQGACSLVVVQGVEVHVQDLVGLAQAVPCSEILVVGVDGPSVALNGGVGVLQLNKLVAHQGPRTEAVLAQRQGPLVVHDGLLVVKLDGVVVGYYAAGLWTERVDF